MCQQDWVAFMSQPYWVEVVVELSLILRLNLEMVLSWGWGWVELGLSLGWGELSGGWIKGENELL